MAAPKAKPTRKPAAKPSAKRAGAPRQPARKAATPKPRTRPAKAAPGPLAEGPAVPDEPAPVPEASPSALAAAVPTGAPEVWLPAVDGPSEPAVQPTEAWVAVPSPEPAAGAWAVVPTSEGPAALAEAPRTGGRLVPKLLALAAVVLVVFSTSLLALLDGDDDGLSGAAELQGGTNPLWWDSDQDFLGDGWELERGLDPTSADSDRDTLPDDGELLAGLDPIMADQDHDGVTELAELQAGTDIRSPDTDGDGLPDGQEIGTSFSPLDSDSFGVSLGDSVLWAFQQRGQAAGSDDDEDGIPDRWENQTGIIAWGPYAPRAGELDLLIEFVRVQGPSSSRVSQFDFAPAYAKVAETFRTEGDVNLQWTETVVELPVERVAPSIPSSFAAYYEEILAKARFANNPYVTTVVMNPQHDQSEFLHAGSAPIRGMLASVNYGAFFDFDYRGAFTSCDSEGCYSESFDLTLSPFLESVVVSDRVDVLLEAGFTDGGIDSNGYVFIEDRFEGVRISWKPHWFATDPVVEVDQYATRVVLQGIRLDSDDLASTILHELGHTLGLCHTELDECFAKLSTRDQFRRAESTMYTEAAPGTLHFLDTEWDNVRDYVACPPAEPIRLLAQDASAQDLADSKYGYALDDVLDVNLRACGEQTSEAPRQSLADYGSPGLLGFIGDSSSRTMQPLMGTTLILAGSVVAAALAFALGWRVARPRQRI